MSDGTNPEFIPVEIPKTPEKKKWPKPILLEYMIGFGFVVFILMALFTQGMFHVKPQDQKPETKETESTFAWDEASVLV